MLTIASKIGLALAAVSITLTTAFIPSNEIQTDGLQEVQELSFYIPPKAGFILPQDPYLNTILSDLIECESKWNPNAINPKDRDGTPSYGLLQFKPGTLYSEAKRYGILEDIERGEIMNLIYDPQVQIDVAIEMIKHNLHSEKFWLQQFPGCFLKHRKKWGI
jgi:hypothetical protein